MLGQNGTALNGGGGGGGMIPSQILRR